MAKEWIAVLRAADAAARWHVHQRRKGAAEEPYINHLLEVAMLVAEATSGAGGAGLGATNSYPERTHRPRTRCGVPKRD
jgi:(p)ppGpp synthase/HD superfamily hydrolase